jgi:hypothetical protein
MAIDGIDEHVAIDLMKDFADAIFRKQRFLSAWLLLSDERRRTWVDQWAVGEYDLSDDRWPRFDRDDVVLSLASTDVDHGLWDKFATETYEVWRALWASLPEALNETGVIHVRRHRTIDEWRALASQTRVMVNAPERVGPPEYLVYFVETYDGLRISDINVS